MSDFKKYYEEQQILEKSGQEALDKIAGGIGKGLRWSFKKFGDIIKKPIVAIFKPVMEALKGKFDAVLTLAEKYYPYDKIIYDEIRKNPNKLKMLDNFLSLYTDDKFIMPSGVKYSTGLDVIYRVYAKVSAAVKDKNYTDKSKTSIRSLEQGAKYVNLRIPQLKTIRDVSDYFEKNQTDQASLLGKWIKAATMFSSWKNKYDNTDEETSTSTIVDQFLTSNSSNIDLDNADKKMEELKEKGIEVNMANIDKEFGTDVKQKVQTVNKNIIDGNTVIGNIQDDIVFDEMEATRLFGGVLQKMMTGTKSDQVCTDIYAVTKYIQAQQRDTTVIDTVLKQTYFYKLFQNVKDPEAKTAFNDIDTHVNDKALPFRNTYLKLVAGTLEGEKMTKELADNIDELIKVIYKNMATEVKQPTV